MAKGLSILNTLILYTGHIIASFCFQGLIGLANLVSAISYYKFHLQDQQLNFENSS